MCCVVAGVVVVDLVGVVVGSVGGGVGIVDVGCWWCCRWCY